MFVRKRLCIVFVLHFFLTNMIAKIVSELLKAISKYIICMCVDVAIGVSPN